MTDYRPARVNADRLTCACCTRVFAAGHVPAPDINGPYAGRLLCRDCRHALAYSDQYHRAPLF